MLWIYKKYSKRIDGGIGISTRYRKKTGEEYLGDTKLNIIIITVWALSLILSSIYLELKLLTSNIGDCILYVFIIASILFLLVIRKESIL